MDVTDKNVQQEKEEQERTKVNKKALINAMQKCLGVVTQACKMVDVSRDTYYTYYNDDIDFKRACDDCSEIALDFAESKLHKQIEDNIPTSTIFFLKTKGKNRGYIERSELTGADGNALFAWQGDQIEAPEKPLAIEVESEKVE